MERIKKIINLLFIYFLPERIYLKYKYQRTIGTKLDLNNPQRLTAKIQWLKINYRRKEHIVLADKLKVRDFVSERIGDKYLIDLYGVFDNPNLLDSSNLQNNTIIKCNHDSSGGVIIRNEKPDIKFIKKEFKKRLKKNHYYQTKEWQYKYIKPVILVEKLLLNKCGKIPNDFKFHCFHGQPYFIYASIDREGENYRKIYDLSWNEMDVEWRPGNKKQKIGKNIKKPDCLDEMIEISRKLSSRLPYCRIDLYEVDSKVYFGEITLHPHGGMEQIIPETYDFLWGSKLDLEKINDVK